MPRIERNDDDCGTARDLGRLGGEAAAAAAGARIGGAGGAMAGEGIRGPAGDLGADIGEAICRGTQAAGEAGQEHVAAEREAGEAITRQHHVRERGGVE
jgi:hypothetical protein